MKQWKSKKGQTQVIGQAELYPLLVARHTWGDQLAGAKVLFLVDNSSAQQAMIRAGMEHWRVGVPYWSGTH